MLQEPAVAHTLCGIDEAGRGALAGPLVVAGVILQEPIKGLRDSKVLTAKQRERLYEIIIDSGALYHQVITSASQIDEKGLSACMRESLLEIMEHLPTSNFLFDGNTTFGVSALRTQIKADAEVDQVSAASIIAKVVRDRIMVELDRSYQVYGFSQHKGYGTKVHIARIHEHGYCPEHRKSFRLKSLQPTLF